MLRTRAWLLSVAAWMRFFPIIAVIATGTAWPTANAVADHLPSNLAGDVIGAVVRIHAEVAQDARTAATLGPVREGNGVVIDSTGLILTIGYLILEADKVEVTDVHGRTLPAGVVGYDHDTGFGLVRTLIPAGITPLRLGDSTALRVGDEVLAVSHAGPTPVVPAQVVSRRSFAGYWEYLLDSAIFTVPPHPDYGGAVLVNSDGQVLGIGSLLVNDPAPGLPVGLGNMFVPVDLLPPILADMLETGRSGKPPHPWLGITTGEVNGRVVVTRATPDGPADRAGIQRGDIVVGIAGEQVSNIEDMLRKIWALGDAGIDVPLDVKAATGNDQGAPRRVVIKSSSRYHWLKLGGGL